MGPILGEEGALNPALSLAVCVALDKSRAVFSATGSWCTVDGDCGGYPSQRVLCPPHCLQSHIRQSPLPVASSPGSRAWES